MLQISGSHHVIGVGFQMRPRISFGRYAFALQHLIGRVPILMFFGSQTIVVNVDDRLGLDHALEHPWLE